MVRTLGFASTEVRGPAVGELRMCLKLDEGDWLMNGDITTGRTRKEAGQGNGPP